MRGLRAALAAIVFLSGFVPKSVEAGFIGLNLVAADELRRTHRNHYGIKIHAIVSVAESGHSVIAAETVIVKNCPPNIEIPANLFLHVAGIVSNVNDPAALHHDSPGRE